MYARRRGHRFNRGRVPIRAGASGGYVPPAYPSFLDTTGGAFYWADDYAGGGTWNPRFDKDTLGIGVPAGPLSCIDATLEATGWAQPEGGTPSVLLNGTTAYLRNDALATLATADDAAFCFSLGYQVVSSGAANALVSWSSSSSTTPKRVLLYTSGAYRWTQQTTTVVSQHNATNTLQQMMVLRQTNNGAGTDTVFTRNVEADPAGTLVANVAAQAVNVFTIGCQWNGGGGPTNFANKRVKWFLILPSGTQLTAAQELELENWVLGAYNTAPLYSDATEYALIIQAGQSNMGLQGIATGAVTGMPDAAVKMWLRSKNNDAYDPTALIPLDRRPGANGYSSYAQYMPAGSFDVPHHFIGVGEGATAIASWNNLTNGQQGLYSTHLHSELRRAIHSSKARFGGDPIIIFDWNQGENDAAAGGAVALAYQASLTTLEAEVRVMVNAAWGTSTFPFHVLQLSDSQTGGGIAAPDRTTIQDGVIAWAGGAADRYESNTDSVSCSDGLHFNVAENAARAAIAIAKFKAIDARL